MKLLDVSTLNIVHRAHVKQHKTTTGALQIYASANQWSLHALQTLYTDQVNICENLE